MMWLLFHSRLFGLIGSIRYWLLLLFRIMMGASPRRSRERNRRGSTKIMNSLLRGNSIGVPKRIKCINIIRSPAPIGRLIAHISPCFLMHHCCACRQPTLVLLLWVYRSSNNNSDSVVITRGFHVGWIGRSIDRSWVASK